MRKDLIVKTLVALVLVWAVALLGARWLGSKTATPEKIVAFLEENPLEEIPESDSETRRKVIADVAQKLNRLDFNQRRDMENWSDDGPLRSFGEALRPEENAYLVELTVEEHFRSLMEAFNQMAPEERRKLIGKARQDMAKDPTREKERERLEEADPDLFDKIIEKGMKSYYRDANAETKMDLAPLLEDLQARIQEMHRRR